MLYNIKHILKFDNPGDALTLSLLAATIIAYLMIQSVLNIFRSNSPLLWRERLQKKNHVLI